MTDSHLHLDEKTLMALIPAFLGSVIAVTRQKNISKKDAVIRTFSGTATSFFLTPVASDLMKLEDTANHWYSALAFLVGMTGYALIPTLSKIVLNTAKTYLKDK